MENKMEEKMKEYLIVWKNSIGNDISRIVQEDKLQPTVDQLKSKNFREIRYREAGNPESEWILIN
jgi:hypothetical protein